MIPIVFSKNDYILLGDGSRNGERLQMGTRGLFRSDGNVLKLDCGKIKTL